MSRRTWRTANTIFLLIAISLATTLAAACSREDTRDAGEGGTRAAALDPALFPVVLETETLVVAKADGSGATEKPVGPDQASRVVDRIHLPWAEGQEVTSPDGQRSAFLRDGKVFFREDEGEPREIGMLDASRGSVSSSWSAEGETLSVRSDDGGYRTFSLRDGGWSPDGQRRMTSELVTDSQEVRPGETIFGGPVARMYVERADGTGRTFLGEIAVPQGDGGWDPPTWSPDGRRIAALYAPGGDVRLLDASGGPPIDIPARGTNKVTWSPDGRFLALNNFEPETNREAIIIVDPTNLDERETLTEGHWPRWSPAGDRIAFKRGNNPSQVFTIRTDGTDLVALSDGPEYFGDLSWSADGQSVEFVRAAPGESYLYAVDLRTADKTRTPRPLTDFGWGNYRYDVHLSPDATQIAFVGSQTYVPKAKKSDQVSSAEGWLILDVATGDVTQITEEPYGDHNLGYPYWAPDGPRFAFSRGSDGVFVARSDGSMPQRISALEARSLAWSPDGERLAVANDEGVTVVSLDGITRTAVDSAALAVSESYSGLEWSSATRLLVIISGQDAAGNAMSRTVLALTDGSPARELADHRGATWSPLGDTMAVIRGATSIGDPVEVWLSNGAGDERMLARLENAGAQLFWSPDGSRIAVASAPFLTSNINVIDVASGATTLVATNVGNCGVTFAGWSPDSQVIYAVPKCALGGL